MKRILSPTPSSQSKRPRRSRQSRQSRQSSQSSQFKNRLSLYNDIKKLLIEDEYDKCFKIIKIDDNGSFKLKIDFDNNFTLSFIYIYDGNIKTEDNIFFPLLHNKDNYNIACKIIKGDENNEIDILKELNIYTVNNETVHFPFFYCAINCNIKDFMKNYITDNKIENKKILKKLTSNYKLILNEKAEGDLTKYFKNYIFDNNYKIDDYYYDNNDLIVQLLLCIITLHSKKIIHNDINGGNFLFHINKDIVDNTYIKYNIKYNRKETIIYIKIYNKCIWTIWDFEISKKVSDTTDYNIDFNSFINMIKLYKINMIDYGVYKQLTTNSIIEYIIKNYSPIPAEKYIIYNEHPFNIIIN